VTGGAQRILTTHAGSLPRPPALLELLAARGENRDFDRAAYDEAVRAATSRTVERQIAAGLDIVNDGEQGKPSFETYRYQRLAGFELVNPAEHGLGRWSAPAEFVDYPGFYSMWARTWLPWGEGERPAAEGLLCCVAPIAWADFSDVEREIANVKSATAALPVADVFMTAISPGTYLPPNLHYGSDDEYLDAMADVMAREYAAILDAGLLLQIDAPDLTTVYRLADVTLKPFLESAARRAGAINRAVEGLDLRRIRVHICWGADEAPHDRDIPLRDLVGMLLDLRPAGLMVAGANGRHAHEWRVWEDVRLPDDKVLVAGVIDSTTNIIEHPEAVAERISRYAGAVGREQLVAGVDCGFGTVARVQQVDEDVAYAKLRALAEGARLASARSR
jgi:5-methyltetrahydropteroyltriglutamate--homocysteine methyltransferase